MVKLTPGYIDSDVAYLLGLIVARGEISTSGRINRITIEFPFRNLMVEGIKTKIDQKDQILISLREVSKRLNELTDIQIREEDTENAVYLILETMKNTIFFRNLTALLQNKTSHLEFHVPKEIIEESKRIQKEFVRGYADVAGSARWSNRNRWSRTRVYLDILNPNWHLPVELCWLIQDQLKVPIDTITYGHPNLRDPKLKEYKAGRKTAWAREHQIKIFTDQFEKIGFYMSHKQTVLEELAEYNRAEKLTKVRFCKPPKRIRSTDPSHPGEKSKKLPKELRGVHCDSYWQICAALGCERYKIFEKHQSKITKFSDKRRGKRK